MVDACDLVNIHKHKHVHTPPTQNSGSTQIDFIFMSSAAAEFMLRCGILDFNAIFSSDHRPLYINIDILGLLGYPVHETI
jgi:endonuclease/exonuclease/phosphatase (EEP) superfamily protein YafD